MGVRETRFEGINPYYRSEEPKKKVRRTEKSHRTRRPQDEYSECGSRKQRGDAIRISKDAREAIEARDKPNKEKKPEK